MPPNSARSIENTIGRCARYSSSSDLDSVGDSSSVDPLDTQNDDQSRFCRASEPFPWMNSARDLAVRRDRGAMDHEHRLDAAALEALARRLRRAIDDGRLRDGTAARLLGHAAFDACGLDVGHRATRCRNARLLQAAVRGK